MQSAQDKAALDSEVWTIGDVARYLRVGRDRVRWLISHRGLPCARWGEHSRTLRFDREVVRAWFKNEQASGREEDDGKEDGEAPT